MEPGQSERLCRYYDPADYPSFAAESDFSQERKQAIINVFSFLDANLASAYLSRMHTMRGYGPAWGFSAWDVMKS